MKKQLSKKDIEAINEQLGKDAISKKDSVTLVDEKYIAVNNQVMLFYHEGKIAPTLKMLQQNADLLKKITVDMGAVKFVVGGADVMRPGILDIEDGIAKDDFVVIIDANNKKPLAVGISQNSTAELRELKSGKVIKNIHYVGDVIWKMII